jgi:hypothetical protein
MKLTVVFCNFTNAFEKIFQKDGDKMWVQSNADSIAGCQAVTETVRVIHAVIYCHLIYLLMVYFVTLLGAQAL